MTHGLRGFMKVGNLVIGFLFILLGLLPIRDDVMALPPPEDTPEEVLRSQIITEARSPFDNKPLSASEYAILQTQIAQSNLPPNLSPEVKDVIFLLQLFKLLNTFIPFL